MTETWKNELRLLFDKVDQHHLAEEEISILQFYLIENFTEKKVSEVFGITLSKARHKIAKARFKLMKIANHHDYLKAREILYGISGKKPAIIT